MLPLPLGLIGVKGGSVESGDTEFSGQTIASDGTLFTFSSSGRLLAPIIVDADNVTIEGATADADDTVIWANFADSVGSAMIDAQGGFPGGSALTTIANAVEPTVSSITWADGSTLPSGDCYLVVREYNDADFFANELDLPSGTGYHDAGHIGAGNTPYIRTVIVHQTSRSGNVSTLERAVGMRFGTGAETEVKLLSDPVKNLTIRNLTLVYYPDTTSGTPDASDYTNAYSGYLVSLIKAMGAINLTVDNVKLQKAGQQAILLDGVYEPAISDVTCNGAWNKGTGGNGYFEVSRTCYGSFSGIVIDNLRHMTVQWSSHSNAFDGITGNSDLNLHGGGSGGHIPQSNSDTAQNNIFYNVGIVLRGGHTPGTNAVNHTPDSATYAPPDFIRANRAYSDAGTTEIFRETFLPFASLDFELSSAQYLSMTDTNWGAYNRAKFAISMWIKRESTGASMRVMFKGSALSTAEFAFQFTTTDRLELRTFSAANVADGIYQTSTTLTDTASWHHLYVEFDRALVTTTDRIKCWVDGSPVASTGSYVAPASDCYTSTQAMAIGAENDGGSPFDGMVFQPAFFSGTLPGISAVYNAGAPMDVTGLAGLYALHMTNMIDPLTTDFVKGASKWVNNNTAVAVLTRPY